MALIFSAWFCAAQSAVAADDVTQPIRVSPDGHFLTQPDGEPFFWLGDWAWELFKSPKRDEVDRYFRDRALKGFTVILAPVTGDFHPLERTNPYGELPLIDRDPGHPNLRYFEHVDWIVARARHYGLRMALMPCWGNLVNEEIVTVSNAAAYGRWLATRYLSQGVVLWVLGGDTNPVWVKKVTGNQTATGHPSGPQAGMMFVDRTPVYDELAAGILQGSGGKAFITYHPTGGNWQGQPAARTSLYLGQRSWLSMNMIQSGHWLVPEMVVHMVAGIEVWNASFNYEPIYDEYRSEPTRPVIDGEPRIEDLAINLNPENGYWKAYDVRNAVYHALFAGAAGANYGNESLGLFYDPARGRIEGWEWRPWQDALHATGSGQMQHAKALLLSRPYFTRIPNQSIIVGDPGRGEPHIGATRDRNGSYAMVYLPHGQSVTVDLSKISGESAIGWWFDPRSGRATRIDGSFATLGGRTFKPPTSGADTDWVLVLDDAGKRFAPPGVTSR